MNILKKLFRKVVRIANEAQAQLIGLTNEISEGEWIQLTPYGDFPHAQGMQRVNRAAADAMANHFNGILAGAKRALFGGVPFYKGHPDVPSFANEFPDKGAYGWIKALEARDDGLYGKVEWNTPGRDLIANKIYKFFSPFWEAKQIANENGRPVYQPTQLLSVGLTNTPNLPVKPLANEAQAELERLTNKAAFEAVKTELTNAKTAFDAERKERIALVLDNAIRDKRITIAERPEWEQKLTTDFANAQTTLAAKAATSLNTESQTKDLGKDKRTFENAATRQAELQAYLAAKMAEGLSYEQAWALAKKERAAIFEQMGKR